MKSFFNSPSFRFPFFAKRPSALERAVRQSPKSRRLRMEPLENRALLAVDAFGGVASLAESNVEETWGPDPAPAALSASVLATVAEIVDVSGVNATLDATSFSVQAETPKPVAPPSFDQLMESLGMIEIESLGDENDVASLSFLDDATDEAAATSDAVVRRVVFYDSSANDFDASFLNDCEPNLYYIDTATSVAEATGVSSRSGGSGGDDATSFEISVNGLTQLSEDKGFPSGGGIAESFFRVVVPYLGSTSRVLRVTPSTGSGAILNQDYMVVANSPDVEGPVEAYGIGGGYFDVSGGATFYVVPLNESVIEAKENFSLGLSVVEYGSGGGTVAELEPIAASIVDDDTFSLDSVTFQNHLNLRPDPTTTNWNPNPWTGPHWVKNQSAATLPVAYACTENAKMSCEAAVSGATDSTCGYQLRAVWEYGGETFTTPWQDFSGSYSGFGYIDEDISVTFSDTFRNIFKGQQAYYADNFTLTWEFKIVGEDTVREIGDSVTPLYVTYDAPLNGAQLYHTVVHTGCKAASGIKTETEFTIFSKIWEKFESLNIPNVDLVNGAVVEGETLTYYGKELSPNDSDYTTVFNSLEYVYNGGPRNDNNSYFAVQKPTQARKNSYIGHPGTDGLLATGDGTCGAWQEFAAFVVRAQGIDLQRIDIQIKENIYNLQFAVYSEIPGQGGAPKEHIWPDHAVIFYENRYYDPSYGLVYDDLQDFIISSGVTLGITSDNTYQGSRTDIYGQYGYEFMVINNLNTLQNYFETQIRID